MSGSRPWAYMERVPRVPDGGWWVLTRQQHPVRLGYVIREPGPGGVSWYVRPLDPVRAGWGGYGTREEAARDLYEDWLASGGHLCTRVGPHCRICGTPAEDCRRPNDGYSACCNKLIVDPESCETPDLHEVP